MEFTRGGGDGSAGEQAYLKHIGFGANMLGGAKQRRDGCTKMADMFPNAAIGAFCWYGRHRAQIRNMEYSAHPDAEVRRLTAIVEQNTLQMSAYLATNDILNQITSYLTAEFPTELNGRTTDKIVINLLMRYKKAVPDA